MILKLVKEKSEENQASIKGKKLNNTDKDIYLLISMF